MSVNLSATTPAAPSGKTNVTWQADGEGNISGYVPTGSTVELQTNGVDNASQTKLNIKNGTNITVTNSGADVTIAGPSSLPPSGTAGGDLSGTYPNPTVVKVNGGSIPASKTIVGTDSSSRIVDASSATLSNNTSGTAANLSGTPALPNGTTATTQSPADNSTKLATTAYADASATAAASGKQNTLAGTGLARQTGACTELSGDVTTSGSNATSIRSSVALTGSPTTTTQTQGDNSTKISTTAYVDAPASGGTPIINIPFACNIMVEATPSQTVFGSSNTQQVVYFVMPEDFTITRVYISIGTPAVTTMGISIYDATGATKLTAADGFSTNVSSNSVIQQTLSSSITLKRKTGYWLAWTEAVAGTLTCQNVLMGGATGFQGIYNKNVVRSGTSGTPTSGGNTNSTLGTISSALLRIPILYFD